jgi:TAG lipase / steryl ester hydrolase / phospholipase A2 / LPA acyltransferase
VDRSTRKARDALAHAQDYTGWRQAAAELDRVQGLDDWKAEDASDLYDWRLIRSRLRQIRGLREEGSVRRLAHHLRQGLHWNLGNIGNPEIYGLAQVGTKQLIADYVAEVCAALEDLSDADDPAFPHAEKLKFFCETAQSYGRSALMLSGGATLGLFHVGVVKALFRENVLPVVMSGSSAGSIVAATVATRAPNEVESLLDPESAYYHFWRMLNVRQMWRRRAVMDQSQLKRAVAKNVRDLSFDESYKLSGRIVNITVSPAGANQPPRLLNYLTFPYLYLREAVLASCAVPVLFPPVMLMTRDENGERQPWMPLLRWNDGSLKSDLPVLRLRRLHNVNHFIVSQTNPHVIPFQTRREPGARGLVHGAKIYAGATLRSQASGLLKLARQVLPIPSVGQTIDTATGILDQDYRGNINIFPDVSLWRYANVTSNPNLADVQRFMHEGERAAWPRIEMIRIQTAIAQTLDRCLEKVEGRSVAAQTPIVPRKAALRVVRSRDPDAA